VAEPEKRDFQEAVRQLVDQLDRAVRRLEEVVDRVDRLAQDRVDHLNAKAEGLVDRADQRVTSKISEVEGAVLRIVGGAARSAAESVREVREGVEGTIRQVSKEVQTVIDRARSILWIAVGSVALLAVFAFVLFYVDRAEDRPTYSPGGVMLFAGLVLGAAPAALAAVAAWKARATPRENRPTNVFAILTWVGLGLLALTAVIVYVRPMFDRVSVLH